MSKSDFELYKKKSSYHCERDETVLISNHPNEIDGVVDLETLNSLKDFSSCVINLEDKIKDKNLEFQEKKGKKIQEELSQLTTQVVNYIEDMMPPPFLRSMLIIPKDQLDLYKLHKLVLQQYHQYIYETCEVVEDITKKLSTCEKNYSFLKNNKRKSRNLFPSFKKKLKEILLNAAGEFGYLEKKNLNERGANRKKIRYMYNKLYKEFSMFKRNNPNFNENLDIKEYPPVVVDRIESRDKNLNKIDSIFSNYDISSFKIIEGMY